MNRFSIKNIFLLTCFLGFSFLAISYVNLRHNYRAAVGQMLVCRDLASSINSYLLEPATERNEKDYKSLMDSYGKVCWMDGYDGWLSTLNKPFNRLKTGPLLEELIQHQVVSEQSMTDQEL